MNNVPAKNIIMVANILSPNSNGMPGDPAIRTEFKYNVETQSVDGINPEIFLTPAQIVHHCIADTDPETLEWIRNMEEKDLISLHMSIGMWIRNEYGLWLEENPYTEFGDPNGEFHPDQLSSKITECMNRELNKRTWIIVFNDLNDEVQIGVGTSCVEDLIEEPNTIQQARALFQEALEDEGLYISYEANIAMLIYDGLNEQLKTVQLEHEELHEVVNVLAERMLSVIFDVERPIVEDVFEEEDDSAVELADNTFELNGQLCSFEVEEVNQDAWLVAGGWEVMVTKLPTGTGMAKKKSVRYDNAMKLLD